MRLTAEFLGIFDGPKPAQILLRLTSQQSGQSPPPFYSESRYRRRHSNMKRLFILTVFAILLAGATQLARADVLVCSADLSGPAGRPANASAGTGFTVVTSDTFAHSLHVQVTFAGL